MGDKPDESFERLLNYLKEQRGFDFTGYKRASLMRRVRRRMDAVDLDAFEDYHDHLQVHPDEFTVLFNTILINVTAFFRDVDAWNYLRTTLLPPLLSRREGQPIRVWSAGCASGEEAYTLAMVLAEVMGLEQFRERVKIYATDVDEEALGVARQASYSAHDLEGVPDEMREKYFDLVGQRYLFRKELRRSVIFGRNDLVQDAPISHVDLLACRNTLMYFNAQTQGQMLNRMHFALRTDGILFLGKAEMLLSHGNLFQPVELKRRFFQKVPAPRRNRRIVPMGAVADVERNPDHGRVRDAALLSSAAAQIVLDEEGRLAFVNHRASTVFGIGSRDIGRPIQDLEISYRPLELRAHLDKARKDRAGVWVRNITWTRGTDDPLVFDVQFVPLRDEDASVIGSTVIFSDVTHYRQLQTEVEYTNRQLETAYEELQSTNEELETTNEELQSTVEELETTNEELQSTNEELETMNEELQSMNDELHMSNEGLRERQDEVDHLNSFLSAILGSLQSGVVVVDPDLGVLSWNSESEELWGVRADEAIGQHLSNLDIGLPVEDLRPLLRRQISGEADEPDQLGVEAVNRRGRAVKLRITVSRLQSGPEEPKGAIIVIDTLRGD